MKTKKETELLLLIGGVIPVIIILFSIFQIRSNNIIKSANEPVNLWSCSFLSDGKTLATAGGLSNPNDTPHRGELVLWDLATSSERFVLKEKSSVRSVTCSPNGQFIAIGEFNGATKLIDPDTGTIMKTLTVQDAVNAVVFSPDTKLVANASLNDKITLWNIETGGKETLVLPGETAINVAVSATSHALVATTRKGKAYIFDLSHPEEKPQELDAYNGPPNAEPNAEAITFAPDGKSFVTGCQKCLRLWECSTGKLIKELNGSAANINSAVFSPDGKSLATVDSDGTLALWNPAVGKLDQTTKAHSGCSFCVAFSPDGSQIATIGRDENTAKIWDAHSLTMVTMLQRTNVSNRVQ